MRAILTYHSIDDSGSPISVPMPAFRRQVEWLRSGRVQVVTIADLVSRPSGPDAVALTFDDGFTNFAAAAPLLGGLPVTLFVVTDHVGRTNEWGGRPARGIPTLPLLDWPALGSLAAEGVTLGAHTRTHPELSALTAAQLDDELAGSAERVRAETGQVVDTVAYPYGAVNAAVAAAAARQFRWGCTTALRLLGRAEARLELPRLDMYYYRRPGQLEAWGTPQFAARLAYRRALRTARRVARDAFAARAARSAE